jgi:DNA polymerase-3 subunit epsilon
MTDLGVEIEVVSSLPLEAAVVAAEAHWSRALGVFDLETTGVDTATARIVTAHVGVIDETGAVVERKDWIVDPGIAIP